MQISLANYNTNFVTIPINKSWNNSASKELLFHRLHKYPAKFPAFLIPEIVNYIKNNYQGSINFIGDIFCGCGTTALEAKLNNLDFWGCDINPVATLIAKAKSENYSENIFDKYLNRILNKYKTVKIKTPDKIILNARINYWFDKNQIKKLYRFRTYWTKKGNFLRDRIH